MTSLQACIPTIAWHSRSEWRNSVIQMIKSSEGSKKKKKDGAHTSMYQVLYIRYTRMAMHAYVRYIVPGA